ncbi:hypothetical protein NIES4071_07740 [Calothrix sp. NIES-4071]|nr:hypothetical protein NIES4071_07740 [Calothrix sp. NIES-4071]BAZ55116.1 hypothetical protein NIES4105_07700 [Calothrix sp. NIES-4105]
MFKQATASKLKGVDSICFTLIKWRLKEIMARYNIKGVSLASRLDVGPNAISALRNAKTMPRLDGVALNSLCNALNELAQDLDKTITPTDLLDYSPDPVNAAEALELFSLRGRHNKKQGKNGTSGQPIDSDTANAS